MVLPHSDFPIWPLISSFIFYLISAAHSVSAATSTLYHWRPPLCLSLSVFLSCSNLMLMLYISRTVSVHVFLMDAFLSSPIPLCLSLFLASLSSPAPLLHQSFSNSLCSAELQLQTYILKEPKLSHVRERKKPLSLICPALPHSLPPSLLLSIQPFIRPSPSKMLFVYHHWSILAPGCCIRISSLTSTDVYMCVCVCTCEGTGAVGSLLISEGVSSSLWLIPVASCWL